MEILKPSASRTDKLCALALAGLLVATTVVYEATDGAAIRAAEALDKPPAVMASVPAIDCTALVEAVEARRAELHQAYRADVPLDQTCQAALWEACESNHVPVCLALGVISVESNFQADAVSSEGCVGFMQLNERYFPADLSPADNIRAGVAYLGTLLERYSGDTAAALVAYNRGSYKGVITDYAKNVLQASEKWGCG